MSHDLAGMGCSSSRATKITMSCCEDAEGKVKCAGCQERGVPDGQEKYHDMRKYYVNFETMRQSTKAES